VYLSGDYSPSLAESKPIRNSGELIMTLFEL